MIETVPEVATSKDAIHCRISGSNGMAASGGTMRRGSATARSGVLAVILAASGCSSGSIQSSDAVDENLLVADFRGVPTDVRRVAQRLASCTHVAGEINGDGSDRDAQVFAAMTALDCDTVARDTSAIRQKYSRNRLVQDALDRASQW